MCGSITVSGIRNAADRRIVHAHGTADFRQTVPVVEMGPSNHLITSRTVGPSPGCKELAKRQPGGKPLSPGNLFQAALVSQLRRQPFDEPLTPEQHLALKMLSG